MNTQRPKLPRDLVATLATHRLRYFWANTALLALALLPGSVSAQEPREQPATVKTTGMIEMTRMSVIDKNLKTLPKPEMWQPGEPMEQVNPRNHYGRVDRLLKIPKPEPKLDSLMAFQKRAQQMGGALRAKRAFEPVIHNFAGQGFSGVNPPDPGGAVGKRFYIQAINHRSGTHYTIYRKDTGAIEAGPFLLSDLGGPTGKGDPIVLYDHLAERWLLSEFAEAGNVLSVFISRTDDPIAGGWVNYQFNTPFFPDYPKYGMWHDAYYVTTNERDGPAIYALDRARMLAGTPANMQRFLANQLTGFGFQALTPVDVDGPAPPAGSPHYVMRHRDDEVHNAGANDATQDFVEIYQINLDWATPASSTMTGPIAIPVAEFDSDLCGLSSFSCFPQPGSSVRLDPLREVIMYRLQYRNFGTHETIVGSFVTDVDGTDHGGIRWFELRQQGGSGWVVHQEGTYAPDSHNRWMSSIAMDRCGNIALAYSVASDTVFPGLRYAGRMASDPMGTLPHGENTLIAGTAANASFRYGDYSCLTIDPVDDEQFWFTGEHNAAATWSTQIASFRFGNSEHCPDEGVEDPRDEPTDAFEYAAKVVCGLQRDPAGKRLVRGQYTTTVNIRNPGSSPVKISKTLALTFPPGKQKPGEVLKIAVDTIPPGAALAVDCADIESRLFPNGLPAGYIEGYVVIRSPASLDVTAVYTSAPLNQQGEPDGVSSIHVEPVPERKLTPAVPERLADLVPVPDPATGSFCRRVGNNLLVTVRNQGTGPAGAFDTTVDFLGHGQKTQPAAGLDAGTQLDLMFPIPTGGFDPDLDFHIKVDPSSAVPETNDMNNEAVDRCIG